MGISACHLGHFFAILINQVSENKDHPLTTPPISLIPQNWPLVSSRNCYLRVTTLRNGERVLQVRLRENPQHAIPHKSGNLLHQIRCVPCSPQQNQCISDRASHPKSSHESNTAGATTSAAKQCSSVLV